MSESSELARLLRLDAEYAVEGDIKLAMASVLTGLAHVIEALDRTGPSGAATEGATPDLKPDCQHEWKVHTFADGSRANICNPCGRVVEL